MAQPDNRQSNKYHNCRESVATHRCATDRSCCGVEKIISIREILPEREKRYLRRGDYLCRKAESTVVESKLPTP